METTQQNAAIRDLAERGYEPAWTDPDGTVTLARPRRPVRHGLHLTGTVLTGGLWAMTGWIWNPRTRSTRTEQVYPDGSTSEVSLGGILVVVCLIVAFLTWLWPIVLLAVVVKVVISIREWTIPPGQFRTRTHTRCEPVPQNPVTVEEPNSDHPREDDSYDASGRGDEHDWRFPDVADQ